MTTKKIFQLNCVTLKAAYHNRKQSVEPNKLVGKILLPPNGRIALSRLPPQHDALAIRPPGVTADVGIFAQHTVAWNEKRNRVLPYSCADSTACARRSECRSERVVCCQRSHRNAKQGIPHFYLKIGATNMQMQGRWGRMIIRKKICSANGSIVSRFSTNCARFQRI